MRRTRVALLALGAVLFVGLLSAGQAAAATSVIDARDDSPGSRWVPPNVTIDEGDTVRWEFDEAQTVHDVTSTSPNWSLSSGIVNPGGPPVEFTFDEAGTYTFVCEVHPTTMTGSVTVEGAEPADPLENVLVFSKTAGFRHDSIPQGIAAIEQLGADNDFNVDASEDSTVFTDANLAQYDAVVFLSTTGDILDDDQQAAFERYIQAGGGYAGIHAAADTEYTWPWYGEMLGGYFRNHPPGTPTASVDIEDGDEPSTTGLPTRWTRTDEWYNFQGPVNPVVNGGGDDYSPRDSDVKVLATVDESTYDEQDGNTADDDHPVAWCSQFDGGRIWYTAMGHTQASFNTEEGNLRSHILGGIQTAAGEGTSDCGEPREASPSASDFEKITIDDDTSNPMELDIASDGRVFYIERDGRVMIWKPTTNSTVQAGTVPVTLSQENGLLGIQLAPNFDTTGHIYLSYSALPDSSNQNRLSRFTVQDDAIVAGSEQIIYTWQHQRAECCHTSGSLAFAPDGSLYISTGDNTNPFDSQGFTPIDERPGREAWDAQRTSANTNDPNGKILHITPLPTASGTPGIGTTYTIPENNLFPAGTAQTLPEIYAMGFRNPFRITVDPKTGWVLMGDYGPDAPSTNPDRGPQGSVEYNVVKEAGNYGWPYCVRQNVAYNDYDFALSTPGPKFNCDAPVNNSPNNTGLTDLPPAKPATMWMGYSETDARFPLLGGGGAPTGGPRYDFDEDNPSDTKFPAYYDGQWFVGEWNNGWIKTATLDDEGAATAVNCFVSCTDFPGDGYLRPMDIEFGPDGSLYVIEWGSGFGGNNADSGIYRIDYLKGERKPIAHATATPDSGPVPLEVQFSSEGSIDPEGTSLTYAWDFDGDGDTDSTDPNPTHTYTTAGNFNAQLTVTDQAGDEGVDNVTIVAGNTRPEVTLELPENGRVADLGDVVAYKVSVTDAEDGSTAAGTIDCDAITVNISLGHDQHAHELSDQTGCEGTFQAEGVSGHGSEANVFTVVEAVYTDEGAGAAGPVTGRAEAILQPKLKQAEFWDTTGRTADSQGGGDPGIVNEATTDTGGGLSAAFVEDGDWISFNPYNLQDLDSVTFRVASAGAGGIIELHYDAADGPLVAATPNIPPTGGWQTWTSVDLDLPDTVPAGTHRLFVVFRHPTATGSLMNLNWFRFAGKGGAVTAPPQVSAAADPASGEAPLEVEFDATATDPEGEALTYEWDFGVPGTADDKSTEEDPTYTYANAGTYTATVTASDESGGKASATVDVRVTSPSGQCPTGTRSDEFDGDALDTDRWTVLRPDAANPFSVEGGQLHLPIANGSMYGPGTTAQNLIVQPTPDGEWMATAKITAESLTENYHQAGLRVWSDDDNWASVHMIHAGGNRDFEFIYENDGAPRNEGEDKLGGIPADAPTTYYVRITSDGTDLTASYSYDGDEFLPVGRPAPLSAFDEPQIGPAALSDAAPSVPDAFFDWIRFDPDETGGGGGALVDEFDGTSLGSAWSVVRQDQNLVVGGGALQIPAAPGDIYGDRNDANNLVVRDAPDGEWTAIAKLNYEGTTQYHQAGIMVYGDDDNFTKFGRLATNAAGNGDEKFEFIYENAGTPRNEAADSTANLPADFPMDYWVRLVSDGTNVTGAYSTDGTTWTPVGRPAPLPADAKIGLFAFSNNGVGDPIASFDSFSLEGPGVGGGGGPVGPSRDDAFDGSSLDTTRWNAIVRDTPAEYAVAGGKLSITTSAGDIYTGDTTPPPNNFILQSADHANADWVIETKIDGPTINGGYGQGGLLAFSDGDNYVKFDAISDSGQTRINRLELRSEIAGAIEEPQPTDPQIAEGVTEIWLRLTKTGQSYAGEYSLDGEAWTPISAPVTNPMEAPDFGLFAFGPQAEGQGDVVPFEYFTLDGEDAPGGECECESSGDEFDGSSLDKTKWNSIVREDDSLYTVEDGALKVTTVNGDIYTGGDPAPTRNFFLQTPDHAGEDWVIETKVSGSISGGYEHGGLLVYQDDGNYIKYDLISDDGTTAVNRIELRSEENDVIQEPQPQLTPLPTGTTEAWLRLTKTGDSYAGEYSFDGSTWTALPDPVQNDMVAPRFGLFTQGVNSGGGEVVFDYFAVDGQTGCEPGEENEPPVLGDVTADPTSGFAPLPVDFTADATDADEDELTYSWDFDGDGEEDADTKNASHTYAEAGVYDAEVTVSDGEAERSKTVQVTVLPADDPEARFRALVFSKTTGFRHDSIPQGIAAIKELGEANDFQVDATEDSTVFRDGVLSHYDTVVFLSTTGDPLNDTQQGAFERYVKAGGGYTGIHAAADTEYEWNWYGKLVGGYFLSHPPGTPDATVHVEDTDHPSTEGITTPWPRTDEWYNYKSPDFADPNVPDGDYSPRDGGVHVLATVDEMTYDEQDGNATDDDHPISWCQRYDGGRSWYTGMGHTQASFAEPDFRKHILGGLEVTAGVVEDEACGNEPSEGGAPELQAFADPSSGASPLHVNFSATALDPDGGEIVSYKWVFDDGSSAFGTSVSRTFTAVGEHTVTITVRDDQGQESSKELTVTVGASAPPEFIEAGADRTSGAAPLTVSFHAVAEDPDGGKVTYRWEFGDGGMAFGAEAEHTYLTQGTFTAKVTATDPGGSSASREIVITVSDPPGNRAPSVEGGATWDPGNAPREVLFTAQGTDPDGDTLTYAWDFGDDSDPVSGRTARHVYAHNGVYAATVTATDRGGLTGTAQVTVTIGNPAGNQAPTVQAEADPVSGTVPLNVNLTAAGSDPDGDPITYVWAFGDGVQGAGPQVTHTYTEPGTYTATVTVKDPGGKTGTATVTITVSAPVAAAGDKPAGQKAAKGAVRAVSVPSLRRFARRGLKVAATCETSGEAAVGLWASKKAARKLGLKRRGLGRARFDCTAGQTRQLTLKPSKKVRRAIRTTRPRSLKITVALALRGGKPITRTVNLKRV
jgi:cytochrome c